MQPIKILVYFSLLLLGHIGLAQCGAGEVELTINTTGGLFASEKWINITDGPNGTGTVLWAQGNGTIGNASGLLTNQSVCVPADVTYYINCYDQYDDTWDGTTYTVEANGVVIADNGGLTPDDALDTDLLTSWESTAAELESSEAFTPAAPTPFPTDVCEDDEVVNLSPPQSYSATSGFGGLALILVTDNFASEITFDLYDLDGNLMYDETGFPGAPASLANNTVYTIFDNSCFDVTQTAGVPDEIDLFDSGNDGIFDKNGSLTGSGFYVYYYASDGIEVFNNDVDFDGEDYISPGVAGFPSFYTASTNQRTFPITFTGSSTTGLFPPPSSYEYVSSGSWSGPGVTNSGTVSKTYFPGFTGLERTITIDNGNGSFDPTATTVGPNKTQTYTYNSVYGAAGPASCNVVTPSSTEIDVHARPSLVSSGSGTCAGATYNVTVDVDLGTYNVSTDEDGVSPFTITGSGGSFSTSSISGTGTQQVIISNIPTGNNWTLNVNDTTGISCGLIAATGSCNAIMASEELSLVGKAVGSKNQLTYHIPNFKETKQYIIEKSTDDGISFTNLSLNLTADQNARSLLKQEFNDLHPFELTYYRIKEIDQSNIEKTLYSNVVVIQNNDVIDANFKSYPVPTSNEVTIAFDSKIDLKSSIVLYNLLGEQVLFKDVQIQKGHNSLSLELRELANGMYTLQVKLENQLIRRSIVKR